MWLGLAAEHRTIPPTATTFIGIVLGKNMEITQAYLRYLFDYDGQNLIHKVARPRVKVGSVAGCICKKGNHVTIGLNGKSYLGHRLIWIWNYGYCPEFLDHINGDRSDNRLSNLREATAKQNAINKKKRIDNITGVKGVSWHKQRKKWRAYININKQHISLGLFKNFNDAVVCRKIAEEKYFGEWNRE